MSITETTEKVDPALVNARTFRGFSRKFHSNLTHVWQRGTAYQMSGFLSYTEKRYATVLEGTDKVLWRVRDLATGEVIDQGSTPSVRQAVRAADGLL